MSATPPTQTQAAVSGRPQCYNIYNQSEPQAAPGDPYPTDTSANAPGGYVSAPTR